MEFLVLVERFELGDIFPDEQYVLVLFSVDKFRSQNFVVEIVGEVLDVFREEVFDLSDVVDVRERTIEV